MGSASVFSTFSTKRPDKPKLRIRSKCNCKAGAYCIRPNDEIRHTPVFQHVTSMQSIVEFGIKKEAKLITARPLFKFNRVLFRICVFCYNTPSYLLGRGALPSAKSAPLSATGVAGPFILRVLLSEEVLRPLSTVKSICRFTTVLQGF